MAQGDPKFASKDNLQKCLDIFTHYLRDKRNIIVRGKENIQLKRLIFETMKSVEKQYENPDRHIYQLNMVVLKQVQDVFIQQYTESTRDKPNIMNLERERDVFGGRNVQVNELIPQRDPYIRKPTSSKNMDILKNGSPPPMDALEQMQRERSQLNKSNVPDMSCFGSPISEEADTEEDFANKLKHLEERRNGIDFTIEKEFHELNSAENVDIRSFYTSPSTLLTSNNPNVICEQHQLASDPIATSATKEHEHDADISRLMSIQQLHNDMILSGPNDVAKRVKPMLPPQQPHVCVPKYISINSADRSWMNDVLRYQYSVTFNGGVDGAMMSSFKNIRSISVGKVIIPDEIMHHHHSIFDGSGHTSTSFNHEFSFAYPYLILKVDELDDVYDGTNNSVRKSFCKLIYSNSYKAPNGRGYIILEPLQNEKKTFYPSLMSSLNRLSLSFLKPNGFLLNSSSDSYKLWKVTYDSFNPHYYQITTNVFFDKNEFFVGDCIIVRGFIISGTTHVDQETQMSNYLNRAEGHEILQIGQVNDNGYWRSFYIKAIGQFDKFNGRFTIDQDVIQCLNEFNDGIDWSQQSDTNGSILNTSLQNTIGMTIEVMVNATTAELDPQLV